MVGSWRLSCYRNFLYKTNEGIEHRNRIFTHEKSKTKENRQLTCKATTIDERGDKNENGGIAIADISRKE